MAIAARVLQLHSAAVTYAKYAPLHALAKPHFYHPNPTASDSTPPKNTQSHDSSSKILESSAENTKEQTPFLAQKSFRERLKLESTFSHNAPFLSSRASETSVAIHKGTQADSRKAHNAESLESTFSKADSRVDCHADFQSARNDRKNAASEKVDSKDNAENIKNLESTFDNTAQKSKKVDSGLNAHSPSLRDTAPAVAWQSISTKNAKADSKQNAQKSQKVDSSSAQNLHDQADTLLSKKAGKKPVLRLFATTLLADSKQNAQKSQKVDSSSAQNLHDQADTLLSKKAGKKPVLRLFATTLLGFLHFAGVNAIYFYIAQGISSSLLFPILRHFPPLIWWVKLPLAFCINLGLCVVFVWGLIALFSTLHTICHKLTLMANRAKQAFVP